MITVEPPLERGILVGAPRKGSPDARTIDEHLDELGRLADTAGAEIVGRLVQHIGRPAPATFIGLGKVDELLEAVRGAAATLVLFDDELTPVQGVQLEKRLGVRVMDRVELILDIFATRARSHEAKLQVELAQLEYLRPRLTRMWTHLSRIRGGIGLRGPGETQLETDRRIIGRRISQLKRELKSMAAHRRHVRQGRGGALQVALVGYTNAGKSSLLNALVGTHEAFVEDRLFATLDTRARRVHLDGGYRAQVVDPVGSIRKLPHHLVASFRATLEEVESADLLLHVVDASHPDWAAQIRVVDELIVQVTGGATPCLYVFNKMDRLQAPAGFMESVRLEFPRAVGVSALAAAPGRAGDGIAPPAGPPRESVKRPNSCPDGKLPTYEEALAELVTALSDMVRVTRPLVEIVVPLTDGSLLARVYRETEVLGQAETNGAMVVKARVGRELLGRLRQAGVQVAVGAE